MDDSKCPELYRRHRPTLLKHVVGQPEAVNKLKALLEKEGDFPHVLLLHGPSGTGKTTIARILKGKLKCGDLDYKEVNCAAVEGAIETAREIDSNMRLAAWKADGPRIWVFEEIQSWSRAGFAQQALLKMFEDTPHNVFFILTTTDPDKLLPAIRTRCTKIALKALARTDMQIVLKSVVEKEKATVTQAVIDKIAENAGGSPREALKQLEGVIKLKTEQEQLNSILAEDTKRQAFDIVRALLWQKSKWTDLQKIIREVGEDEDWERFRHLVLKNAGNEILKDNGNHARAYLILDAFADNWFTCGRSGLLKACWEVAGQ